MHKEYLALNSMFQQGLNRYGLTPLGRKNFKSGGDINLSSKAGNLVKYIEAEYSEK